MTDNPLTITTNKVEDIERAKIRKAIAEYKSFLEMKKELEKEADELKKEITDYMTANGLDTIVTDHDRVSYTEVLQKRVDTTALKKDNLYDRYAKATAYMRLTVN